MRRMFPLSFAALCSFCGAVSHAQQPACPDASSHIVVERGSYSSQPGVSFALHHFSATLVPMGKTLPACLAKMTDVAHADIFVSNESLTKVFAKKMGATASSIQNLKIENGLGKVSLSGEMVKIIPLKFTIEGPVTTDGTLLLLNAKKINADGIPLKLLLTLVGQHLGSMVGFKGVSGVEVNENVISFSPEKIAHLKGYIASVDTTPQGIKLHYGPKPHGLAPHPTVVAKVG